MKDIEELIPTSIRINKEFYEVIKDIAKEEKRSVNFVINDLIKKALGGE